MAVNLFPQVLCISRAFQRSWLRRRCKMKFNDNQQANPQTNPQEEATTAETISRRRFVQGAAAVFGGAAFAGLAVPNARALRHLVQGGNVVNVTAAPYNAVGNGSTDNRAAFQAAINDAVAQGRPLYIPAAAQFYRVVLNSEFKQLEVSGNLTIIGDGRSQSRLQFEVSGPVPANIYAGIQVKNGVNFTMSDVGLDELQHPVEYEINGIHFVPGPADHVAVLERVNVAGFSNCVYVPSSGPDLDSSGELFLTLRACDLSAGFRYCVAFWAAENGHKRLHMYNSYCHDNSDSHLVYCHPHNSVHVENCRFDGATDWAWQFQGSTVSGDPDYQRFIGCWFGSRNGRGIITQDRVNTAVRVEVRNCLFEGRPSVQIRSDILIEGCYFTTPLNPQTGQTFISAYSNAPWRAEIRNCIFAPKASSLPMIDLRLEGIEVLIENCQFYNRAISGATITMGGASTNRYTVINSLFYSRPDINSQAIGIEASDGQIRLERCRFIGRFVGDRAVIFGTTSDTGPSAEARLEVVGNYFQSISGGSLFHMQVDGERTWSNKIVGSNNVISNLQTTRPILTVEPGNAPFVGQLAPRAGVAPAPIVAGATILVTSNYDHYPVNGTADISNIHWWTADGLSNPLFSGTVTLEALTGFNLVGGGNIATPRQVAAGQQVRLNYNPQQGVWNEVSG